MAPYEGKDWIVSTSYSLPYLRPDAAMHSYRVCCKVLTDTIKERHAILVGRYHDFVHRDELRGYMMMTVTCRFLPLTMPNPMPMFTLKKKP